MIKKELDKFFDAPPQPKKMKVTKELLEKDSKKLKERTRKCEGKWCKWQN